MFLLRTKRRIAYAAIIIALFSFGIRSRVPALALAGVIPYQGVASTLARLDGLLLGSALAMAVRSSWRDRMLRFSPAVFAAGVVILSVHGIRSGIMDEANDAWMHTVGILSVAITSCAAIAASLRSGSLFARSMESAWLRFFGRYSYGLYVLHYTIHTALGNVRPWVALHLHSKLGGVLIGATVSLTLSIVAAMLSYRFFEAPILALKRHFQDDSPTHKLRRQLNTAPPHA